MSTRPTVLVFLRHYLPGYKSGGPIRTIANLVERLGDRIDFKIVTCDRDATDSCAYAGVVPDTWTRVGKADVWYSSPAGRRLPRLLGLLRATPRDVLYLNSFFDSTFTIPVLLIRFLRLLPWGRLVLAPRGEFAPAALSLKPWRKRLYLILAQASGMVKGATWQASSPFEKKHIERVIGQRGAAIVVAADLPELPNLHGADRGHCTKAPSKLRIVFLSRITPMKNLDGALRILRRLKCAVEFNIYGPVRDSAYWKRCQQLMGDLPTNVEAHYRGSVEHNQVAEVLRRHDLFFLPTLGENFGHVILEAMLSGTPVLISDRTPWRGLERVGGGWDVSIADEASFADIIERCARLDAVAFAALRRRVYDFAIAHTASAEAMHQNLALFSGCRFAIDEVTASEAPETV